METLIINKRAKKDLGAKFCVKCELKLSIIDFRTVVLDSYKKGVLRQVLLLLPLNIQYEGLEL